MVNMKIVVTTSNNYLHIVPIFCYLFNKNWGSHYDVEIVGYDKPKAELPDNFTFHSMGKQGAVNEFSTDLGKYFSEQPDWFIWMMEDTFLKKVDHQALNAIKALAAVPVGRIALTSDSHKFYTLKYVIKGGIHIYKTPHFSNYRLSCQPAIWNKKYLLRYMKPGLTPWQFECQECPADEFENICMGRDDAPVSHNEGVRKHDLHTYDLNGLSDDDIAHIKTLL